MQQAPSARPGLRDAPPRPRPRFRLTAPEPYERDIHAACVQALDRLLLPPAMFFTYPAGALELTPAQMARLARIGLKRGLPDLWVLFEGCYGIELKREGGALSKTRLGRTRSGAPRVYEGQEDVFPKLLASGGVRDIAICHSVDEVLAQLEVWAIPLRRFALG